MAALTITQLTQAIQMGQMAVALVRGIVAAFRSAGQEVPSDAELIRILGDNSAAGKAEADALIARLKATQTQG